MSNGDALSALNQLDPSCPRDEWVRIAMSAKAAGLSFQDFHGWSKGGANYADESDCKAVWKSISDSGGITEATLFSKALENGWKDSSKKNSSKDSCARTRKLQHAIDVWEKCFPATPEHEYILRKQGIPIGLRYYPPVAPELVIAGINVAGFLVIPCWSNGELQTLQFIPPIGGKKLNLPGASFNDGYLLLGEYESVIYLCEGIGQSWSAHQATGHCAVICFGYGRMMGVAKIIRKKFPNSRLVVIPDRGKERLAADIAAAVAGEWVELPENKPSNYDANDYALEHGRDELALLLERLKPPEMRYKLLSGDDLINLPPMRWLVKGVFPAEGLAAIYGASGSGKSFLILDMALAIAIGDEYWFGRRLTHVPVTYICLEGQIGFGKRIKAWNLYCKRKLPNALRCITQPFNLLSDDVTDIANAVITAGWAGGLLIIDTLNRAIPGADENSSIDMGKIIAAAQQLKGLIGGLILLVHHTGKDAAKGLRGHSSLYAALDGAIEVTKIDSRREWSVSKSKDDATEGSYQFRLETVPLNAVDGHGDRETSCVVVPEESFGKSKCLIPLPKSVNQKIIWKVLCDLLSSSNDFGKGGAPEGRACIRLEVAFEKVRGHLLCDRKRQTERTKKAIEGLIAGGLITNQDGWLWAT